MPAAHAALLGSGSIVLAQLERSVPTLLLIDDDTQLLRSLASALEEAGYTALQATRLDVAGRMIATEAMDAVVLDVATEHGQGWEFLREAVEFRGLPVIVLSGHAREEDISAAFNLGAADFLAKPYRTAELLARLKARVPGRSSASAGSVDGQKASRTPTAVSTSPAYGRANDEVDSPLFMDMAAEHSLLQERMRADVYAGNIEELPLSARLRTARQRLNLSLVQIELDTKLRIWYLQAMEEDRFGMLPRGSAEQMLKTYAKYLGLDVPHAVADFRAEHADLPFQPLAYLGGRPEPRDVPQWLVVSTSALLALVLGLGAIWWFAADEVVALNTNLRTLVRPPTATATPMPTRPPTLTPTATPAPTLTSTPRPTETPSPTSTPEPTVGPTPIATPGP